MCWLLISFFSFLVWTNGIKRRNNRELDSIVKCSINLKHVHVRILIAIVMNMIKK